MLVNFEAERREHEMFNVVSLKPLSEDCACLYGECSWRANEMTFWWELVALCSQNAAGEPTRWHSGGS
jgi:hypothetical protein